MANIVKVIYACNLASPVSADNLLILAVYAANAALAVGVAHVFISKHPYTTGKVAIVVAQDTHGAAAGLKAQCIRVSHWGSGVGKE
jgi:hypothetical protein